MTISSKDTFHGVERVKSAATALNASISPPSSKSSAPWLGQLLHIATACFDHASHDNARESLALRRGSFDFVAPPESYVSALVSSTSASAPFGAVPYPAATSNVCTLGFTASGDM